MPGDDTSVLVLNTLSLLEAAIRQAKDFRHVDLFFDRDQSGQQASVNFIKACSYATDRSAKYEGFKDYNDKLSSVIHGNRDISFQPDVCIAMPR